MKKLTVACGLTAILVAGCVSKSTANAKARAAYLAGQQQGMAMAATQNSVWVVGNVKNPIIPWTDDLTLIKAIVAADYLGEGDPGQIALLRNGQPTKSFTAKQLLGGFDLPLLAGDRIEVRQ
jgi:hypothetical protein